MSLFLLDWTKCLFGSTNTFSGSWGSLDCTTSTSKGCHTVSYDGKDCLRLDNHYSSNTYDVNFGCDVKDVSFDLFDISLSKCGDNKLCDVIFKNALGQVVEAKYEWINNCVRVTCDEPIQSFKVCYEPSFLNNCDLKIGPVNCAPVPTVDGVVEGTAGDDLIDVAYTGDPDGDKIDNNDAILAGETGHDDIVVAGDGDDTVIAANGNDEVYGGDGNDDIYGGAGNDILIGDRESTVYGSPSETTTVRESFNWSQAPDPHDNTSIDNNDHLNTFTQNTGSVNVTFSTVASVNSPETNFATDQQKVHSIDSGSESVNAYSSLESELNAKGESATYQWSFDKSVENISFRINDVDYDSTVQVYAYDANGVAVPVSISAGGGVTLKNLDGVAGNETGVSNGGGSADTDPYYSMLVNVTGPITKLVVKHLQDGYDNAGVNITDLFYDVTLSTDDGVPGDDFIDGGAGDDYIEGNQGNDTLIGGSGDDTVYGGKGNDTIQGDGDSTGNVGSQPAVLDWSDFGSAGATVANGATQDLGGVTVTFGFDAAVSGATATVSGAAQYVETGENFDNYSGLQLYGPTTGHTGDTSTVTLDFASNTAGYSDEVQNVAFRINDIDVGSTADPHQDILTIHAYDANGVEVPVTFVAEGGQTISGNTITAHDLDNGSINTGTAKGSVLIQIADPVARIVIDYGNGATTDQAVTITDLSLETILADDDAGNDYLDGGAGDDLIEGNEGDDRLIGGDGNDILGGEAGNDILDGGDGADTILGGTDADVIYGGAGDYVDGGAGGNDYDVLDLTGKGPFYLENVTPDSNGNGTNGTVVFVDENGVPTGETLTYVEIENIIGDFYNRAPDANDDTVTTDEDTPIVIDVLANDSDPDGDQLTITDATVPAEQGTVEIVNGKLVFTPADDFNGEATISYTVTDPDGNTDTANVVVTVNPVEDAPEALDDTATTDEDTPVTIDVLANDSDPDGQPLTITEATVPAEQGTVEIVNGKLVFTPAEDFNGDATISYTVTDPDGNTDTANVVVTVNPVEDAPEALDDTATTDEDTPVTIDVLDNDSDPDGQPLTITEATVPAEQGTVEIVNGKLVFTPADDFNGEATISYTVTDPDGNTDTANVVVSVNGLDDTPDAEDDCAATLEDTPVTIDVLENDSDPDGQTLVITEATVPVDQGTVEIVNGKLVFTPAENFNGPATISYTVSDPDGNTDTAVVDVDVLPVNDLVAVDDVAQTNEDTPVTIDVVANDQNPDGGAPTVIGATVPAAQGTVAIVGNKLVFTPAANFYGEATIDYTIEDEGGAVDVPKVTVTVNSVIEPPIAVDDVDETDFETPVTIDVLANDSDPDGTVLTVTSATVPDGQGTVEIVDNKVVFTPADGFEGEATISYNIEDADGQTDDTIVTVTVNDAPPPPPPVPDGTVEGTAGDDIIDDSYAGDPNGDYVDNDDAILPGDTGDDDLIYGYEGDDTILSGDGDDEVYGGVGNDTITDDEGSDTVYGDEGDDVINTSGGQQSPDTAYPGLFPADTDPFDDRDTVYGGEGNDTITTGDDNDTIHGGTGNDTIDGGVDDDLIYGEEGNDTIIGGEGDDEILGGEGDDLIYGGLTTDAFDLPDDLDGDGDSNDFGEDLVTNNNRDTISGGAGNDTIYGGDDDDLISGGTGNDYIDGGIDDDVLIGNDGDDTLIGGQGDDNISGGDDNDIITGGIGEDTLQGVFGNDTFIGGNGGDVVVGGEDADGRDIDVLNLTGSGVDHIIYNDTDPEAGIVFFNDGSTMTFSEIENVIPCFTPGTLIATPRGQVPVEQLHVGDKIITRDNGIQEIAWLGQKEMPGKQLIANPHLKPILIKAGALGNGLPERDMLVSPNHRVLVASDLTQLYFEEREVLAAAKHLVGSAGIHQVDVTNTTYIHFMFERHEVVLSDGAWTESFQPGDYSLKGIGNSQRNEIFELFPELKEKAGIEDYQSARRALKKHEAKLLVR